MMAQAVNFSITPELKSDLRGIRTKALILGVLGTVASAAGFLVGGVEGVNQFYRSYLWSYIFVLSLSLGPLTWLTLQYVTGGAWGVITRRSCEAAARTLPLVAVMFLPVVIGINNLYPWAHANIVAKDPLLQHKAPYLNLSFFLIRAVVYFAGWLFLGWWFNRWSEKEDTVGHEAVHRKMSRMAGPGLLFLGFSVTFMAVDWILSVDPKWFSTIFGLLCIVSQCLTAMAFLIALMVFLSSRRPMSEVITHRHLHDMGKLLLALVMVWAYFSFSQFLIIWAGNLPEEIPWYIARLNHGWQYVALALVFGHFALPFALLLSRDLKRNFKLLGSIAVFVLLMRFVDLYWLITPGFRKDSFGVSWLDFTVPIGLVGLWLAWFLTQLEKRPLIPLHALHLEETLEHGRE